MVNFGTCVLIVRVFVPVFGNGGAECFDGFERQSSCSGSDLAVLLQSRVEFPEVVHPASGERIEGIAAELQESVARKPGSGGSAGSGEMTAIAGATSAGATAAHSSSKFCNGVAMDMHMRGLSSVFAGDRSSRACVIFLLSPLVLDTPRKFLAGCLGALFLGLFTGALLALRRVVARAEKPYSFVAVQLPLYGLTLLVGYLDMLLVMAYNLELLSSVILGLMCGHALFHKIGTADTSEGATPCCSTD